MESKVQFLEAESLTESQHELLGTLTDIIPCTLECNDVGLKEKGELAWTHSRIVGISSPGYMYDDSSKTRLLSLCQKPSMAIMDILLCTLAWAVAPNKVP